MAKRNFLAEHWFHAVGQGLFSSGTLAKHDGRYLPGYRWVYDCGTSSSKRHLNSSIAALEERVEKKSGSKPILDLVVVSHFDHDHISGLVSLLSKFRVRDLLLPYLPLWQRLAIASLEGRSPRSMLSRFLINPTAFVLRLPEGSVERILFAAPGGQAPGPYNRDPGTPPRLPERNIDGRNDDVGNWPVEAETTDSPDEDEDEEACLDIARRAASARGTSVQYLRAGGAIVVAGIWEFIPYNDAELAPLATDSFRRTVSKLRNNLLQANDTRAREIALDKIKAKYDNTFKKSSERRNLISLFLYSGPMVAGDTCATLQSTHTEKWLQHTCAPHSPKPPGRDGFGAVLYTGDGFLDTIQRFRRLRAHLGPTRIERIDVLQVMHHGSKNNWYEKLAGEFDPMFSVFCSDPLHKKFGHPHEEVLRDFWTYGPMQVDAHVEAQFTCRFSL